MAEKKEPRDEKLIEELYERLWWYTYEASEEEFDEKEVDAITRLLDVLEPVYDDPAYEPGADAALKRFWERYGEEEENAAMEDRTAVSAGIASIFGKDTRKTNEKEYSAEETSVGRIPADKAPLEREDAEEKPAAEKTATTDISGIETLDMEPSEVDTGKAHKVLTESGHRKKWRKRFIRIAIGAVACVVLLISVNVGSYALRKKSFFEIVREEIGRTEITVTGNTEEFEENADDAVKYSSWEEVKEIVGKDILEPTYIPEGYKLESLSVQSAGLRKTIVGYYENDEEGYLRIRIKVYQKEFKKDILQYEKDWSLIEKDEKNGTEFYGYENIFEAVFSKDECLYYILSNENIEILKKIVDGMA